MPDMQHMQHMQNIWRYGTTATLRSLKILQRLNKRYSLFMLVLNWVQCQTNYFKDDRTAFAIINSQLSKVS